MQIQLYKVAKYPVLIMILVGTSSFSIPALSQSIESCMTARMTNALSICRSLINNGSRSAKVYFKLASTHHEMGNTGERDRILSAALKIHPKDADLGRLKSMLGNTNREDQELKKAAQKDLGSLNRGTLKLECFRDDTARGLAACQQFLTMTEDSRVRTRLAYLESTNVKPLPAPPPQDQIKPEPADEIALEIETETVPNTSPTKTQATSNAAALARKEFKEQARRIQYHLSDLGFDVGVIDGAPGPKTLRALSDFYTVVGLPKRRTIDGFTEQDLESTRTKLNKARQLFSESQQLKAENAHRLALDKLASAEAESPLLAVPFGYRDSLESAVKNIELAKRGKTTDPKPAPKPAPAPDPITVPAPAPAPDPIPVPKPAPAPGPIPVPAQESPQNQQLQQLLAQIKLTRNQLNKQRLSEKEQLSALRSIVILD